MNPWLQVSPQSDFSIHNLPFGIFSYAGKRPRVGVAIGDYIIDMKRAARYKVFADMGFNTKVFGKKHLNHYIALGKAVHKAVRQKLQSELTDPHSRLAKHAKKILIPLMADVEMHLSLKIGDYTDFYSSQEHATNVGKMFRGEANALMPNWKHMPIAYHGRASSVVVSGVNLHRPKGQTRPNDEEPPVYGPSRAVDFELEVAFVVGKNSPLGQPIGTAEAEDYIFGFLLFNDWSARDIQKWEYQPLGPFLGKNFGSSVSPWVVQLAALEPFRTQGPVQDVPVLPYLQCSEGPHTFDIQLEVAIEPSHAEETVICRSNFKYLYWNVCQQIAHHTVNGCNLRIGDLLASGTISGPTPDSFGSLLELTWGGKNPLQMADGSERRFLQDGDTLVIRGFCEREGMRVGFGEVRSTLLPAV